MELLKANTQKLSNSHTHLCTVYIHTYINICIECMYINKNSDKNIEHRNLKKKLTKQFNKCKKYRYVIVDISN